MSSVALLEPREKMAMRSVNYGNQKAETINQPAESGSKGLVPDGARTDDKYGLRTATFGGFGCITITVGAAICVVGVITLMLL